MLLLAIIYLINPLQRQLLEGIHAFSHILTQTDSSHHHEEDHLLEHEHTHKHKIIALFSKILSFEKDHDEDNVVLFDSKMDKHFAQQYPVIDFKFKSIVTHIYYYTFHISKSVNTIPSPPPEIFFS